MTAVVVRGDGRILVIRRRDDARLMRVRTTNRSTSPIALRPGRESWACGRIDGSRATAYRAKPKLIASMR
ncbi:MAG TPA: hypothetical protein VHY31_24045 [Streptosporangiaceae bacterium]|nr:hypothetical protein [Streptosporangiaceae bacterium]